MLAAGESIEVNSKRYKLRPVVAQHLCDLEREALRYYKRQYLQTFVQNADLMGNGDVSALMERKMEEVARWDLGDLPQRDAYDASRCPVTDVAMKWATEKLGEKPDSDIALKAMLNTALDNGELTPVQVKEMTGAVPLHGKVRYDQWWITASVEGMISLITSSIQYDHPEVTREIIAQWSFGKLAEAAHMVTSVTVPNLKNG